MKTEGCLICGAELIYREQSEIMKCSLCNIPFQSNAHCLNGHFVCDVCHEMEGFEWIKQVCTHYTGTNPIDLANQLMSSPRITMHGPEHHFLVPAALITPYYSKTGLCDKIPEKLNIAQQRAKNILGGFCGFYGNCGAGVGSGIFLSIVLNSSPLKNEEWKLSNLITSQCLHDIALKGGPRCCKRNTFTSLETSLEFLEENLRIKLDTSPITCNYFKRNKECKRKDCTYFPVKRSHSDAGNPAH